MRLWALLLHIAKIPSHRQTYSTPSMPAFLAPNKCLGGCIGSPFARIEQVTTVERHHQTAIEKTLTKSKVYRSATATVALWDGLPAAVVAVAWREKPYGNMREAWVRTFQVKLSLPGSSIV